MAWDPYEISDKVPNRAVLTATFTGHCSRLTPSARALYTEITFHVGQIFDDRTGTGHPAPNRDITVILYGGTVKLANGEWFFVQNPAISGGELLQPDHKYLLVLGYHSNGDFYGYGDSWDMTDSILRANSARAQYFVMEHRSALDGLPVEMMGPAIDKLLKQPALAKAAR